MNESVATPIVATTRIARGGAAERMRRSRKRRRNGFRCYRLELHDREIEGLVRRGLLPASEQTNRNAIIKAMYAFFDRTLGRSTRRATWVPVTRNGGWLFGRTRYAAFSQSAEVRVTGCSAVRMRLLVGDDAGTVMRATARPPIRYCTRINVPDVGTFPG